MIPVKNKNYNYFDDGKISKSRRDTVTITDVLPFSKISKDILEDWKIEVEHCHWLYRETTDYFIKGRLNGFKQDVVFVRTKDNGWFSLGWWAGRLDIDGSLTEKSNNLYRE